MMMTVMTTTALRREVCALLSLALLCCCASVCVAAATGAAVHSNDLYFGGPAVNVSVEISCADSENKSQWRFPGQSNWTKCALAQGAHDHNVDQESTAGYTVGAEDTVSYTVYQGSTEYSPGIPYNIIEDVEVVTLDTVSEDSTRISESLCLWAERMYSTAKCNESCTSSDLNKTAFTMEYSTSNASGVYKKWLEYTKSSNDAAASSTPGVCPLKTTVEGTPEKVNSGLHEAAAAASAAQVPAVEAPAAGQAAGSSSSAASGAPSSAQTIEQGIAPADPQPGNTSQLPTGEGVGRTDGSGTTQTPSATPASGNGGASGAATAGAASQSGNPTYTRETNNSAATGAQDPGTSDSSAIATAWVHTPLLLLLTALACAAGQRCGAATQE
ncbi:mucin-like glycoprotein [Trypanosoma cruzi]|uniref:Mucin-like glycoprotein, putative n=1 Tax=Trypanosoma cruzi (strain CL Brener) TaxID=353153 RepID=Q4DY75_TRYCC|nr:mucin-like glycoprotein, putative [Trypanosoma cruzi]EAN97468.1 mucin-like glycoprotein, putative [Trypanosoma cruzi]RNC39821.1 mucin-like glycoprotein [Trypanosoma cruzi]|eukprot:XP_819319.1 mucin-like glycoprotein [Trypanosoma cruzi strain CL Brener]